MSMNEPKTEWIRLVCTPTDKALLETLSRENMDDSISSTVRRLIRQEAKRQGLASDAAIPDNVHIEEAA